VSDETSPLTIDAVPCVVTSDDRAAQERLRVAEDRFRATQEKLKSFIEEHMEFSIDGLHFVNEQDCGRLGRQLAELRREHDVAGAAWGEALAATRSH
jgi:hypothetical protein